MPYPTSDLSHENVLRDVHDAPTQTLRVSATALVPPGLEVEISAADGDNIAISDGTNTMDVNPDGSINVVPVGPIDIEVDAADGDNIAIKDVTGTNAMNVYPDGSIDARRKNTLITVPFDYIVAGYPSTTVEVYTYKFGGAGGTIVGVITVTYTDATKNLISTVAKV